MEALVNALKILKVAFEGRHLNLYVATRFEVHGLALRQPDYEFFNKGGYVIVRNDFTLPLFDREYLWRHLDLHILFDRYLTR